MYLIFVSWGQLNCMLIKGRGCECLLHLSGKEEHRVPKALHWLCLSSIIFFQHNQAIFHLQTSTLELIKSKYQELQSLSLETQLHGGSHSRNMRNSHPEMQSCNYPWKCHCVKRNYWETKQIKPGLVTVDIHGSIFHKSSFPPKSDSSFLPII